MTPYTPAVKQPEALITTLPSHDAPHNESESTAQVIKPVLKNPSDNILTGEYSDIIFTSSVRKQEVIFPDNPNEPELSSQSSFLPSHDASLNESNISSVVNTVASDVSDILLQGILCKWTKCKKKAKDKNEEKTNDLRKNSRKNRVKKKKGKRKVCFR